jgi:hypothetical protein
LSSWQAPTGSSNVSRELNQRQPQLRLRREPQSRPP